LRAVIPYFFSAALLGATCVKSAQIAGFPDWAYPPCVRAATEADNSRILSVAGSKVHFTEADLDASGHDRPGGVRRLSQAINIILEKLKCPGEIRLLRLPRSDTE
jgi:hypothetical protein